MAIAFNSYAAGTSHNIPAGSNLLLLASIANAGSPGSHSVTYGGQSMTQYGNVQGGAPFGNNYIIGYYLCNPPTGNNSFVVTGGGGVVSNSYTGAAQSNPIDAFNSFSETASGDRTISVTVVATNCWIIASHWSANVEPASLVNLTQRGAGIDTGNDQPDTNGTVGTGSQAVGWHWNSSDNHIGIAASFKPASPVINSRFFMFMPN